MNANASHSRNALDSGSRQYEPGPQSSALRDPFFASAHDAIVVTDLMGRIVQWNPAAAALFGHAAASVLGRYAVTLLIPAAQRHALRVRMQRFLATNDAAYLPMQEVLTALDVEGLELSVAVTIVTNIASGAPAFVVFVRDMSERPPAQLPAHGSDAHYRALVEGIPAVTFRALPGASGKVTFVSPQIEHLLGYPPQQFEKEPHLWLDLIHTDDRPRVLAEIARANDVGASFSMMYRMRTREQRVIWVRCDAALLRDEHGKPRYWHGIVTDITAEQRQRELTTDNSLRDIVTNLPNRSLLIDRTRHALADVRRNRHAVAIAVVDLARIIDSSAGPPNADSLNVLTDIAWRLQGSLRASDTASRIGGAEFAILMQRVPNTDIPRHVVRRVQRELLKVLETHGRPSRLAPGIGIAVSALDTSPERADELLSVARATERRTSTGDVTVVMLDSFSAQHDQDINQFHYDLRHALARDEFVLRFEPLVSLQTGELAGFVALLRWNHPGRGVLPAAEFMPPAHELGVGGAIERWALKQACALMDEWRRRFPRMEHLRLHISMSVAAVQQPNLVEVIHSVLNQSSLPSQQLILEVSESNVMADASRVVVILHQLRQLGIKLLIEKFGNSDGTLFQLRSLPIDYIKIDSEIIADLGIDLSDTMLVSGIVGLAHSLGLIVVAERISTFNQLQYLVNLQCDLGHGHFFWSALSAGQVTELLTRVDSSAPISAELVGRLNSLRQPPTRGPKQ